MLAHQFYREALSPGIEPWKETITPHQPQKMQLRCHAGLVLSILADHEPATT